MSSRLQGNWLMTQAYSDQCVGGGVQGSATPSVMLPPVDRRRPVRPISQVSLETLHGLHCAGCEPGFLGDPCGAECTARSKGTQLIDAG